MHSQIGFNVIIDKLSYSQNSSGRQLRFKIHADYPCLALWVKFAVVLQGLGTCLPKLIIHSIQNDKDAWKQLHGATLKIKLILLLKNY